MFMKKVVLIAGALSFWCLHSVAPSLVLAPQKVASGFTIAQPGRYVIRGDAVTTLTSMPTISIQSSNVILDLNGKSIAGSGLAGTAIEVAGAFENITIKNGIISGFHQRGISIANGVSNILVQDIKVTGTSSSSLSFIGFDFAGGAATSKRITIRDSQSLNGLLGVDMEDCDGINFERCAFGNNGEGINLLECTNVAIKDTDVNSNTTNGIDLNTCDNVLLERLTSNGNKDGILVTTCNGLTIRNASFDNNSQFGMNLGSNNSVLNFVDSTFNFNARSGIEGSSVTGMYIDSCQASNNGGTALATSTYGLFASGTTWLIRDSDFSSNNNTSVGTGLRFGGNNFIIDNCTLCNNSSSAIPASRATGLHLLSTVSCIVRNCTLNGNFSNDALTCGIEINTAATTLVENCTANGNVVLTNADIASGFRALGTTTNLVFLNCIASSNSGSLQGNGFRIESSVANLIIKNSQAVTNSSTGFFVASTSSYLFGNVAVGNPSNYTGGGTFGFLTVSRSTNTPQGTFDERMIDNIAIT
jgi:hypothetical protein